MKGDRIDSCELGKPSGRNAAGRKLPKQLLRRVAEKGRGWAFTPHDFADLGPPRSKEEAVRFWAILPNWTEMKAREPVVSPYPRSLS